VSGPQSPTWAQRRRRDADFPDTMSPQARRLAEMRSVLSYWQARTGPAYGYALDAPDMIAIADRACLDIAAGLIAEGFKP